MIETRPLERAERYVLQVSRWDALKDPLGVIDGFVDHVAPHTDAHLVLRRSRRRPRWPTIRRARSVYAGAARAGAALPAAARERVHLALLPMDDVEENAVIVNALQRRAAVVVQKSLAEGFGLTVAEAMWKSRPVVASRIGGIQDQIEHGETGLLLDDPALAVRVRRRGAASCWTHPSVRPRDRRGRARKRARALPRDALAARLPGALRAPAVER